MPSTQKKIRDLERIAKKLSGADKEAVEKRIVELKQDKAVNILHEKERKNAKKYHMVDCSGCCGCYINNCCVAGKILWKKKGCSKNTIRGVTIKQWNHFNQGEKVVEEAINRTYE